MQKEVAQQMLQTPIVYSQEPVDKVKNYLEIDDDTFRKIMEQPIKTYRDFPTYKSQFETDEPFWREMYKIGRVPKSFYLKYCSKTFM